MNQSAAETSNTAPYLSEQSFLEIIAAISDGKYSWACLLLLRAAGYNPAHYIPTRTYKRIVKANRTPQDTEVSQVLGGTKHSSTFSDISHVKKISQESSCAIHGGFAPLFWPEGFTPMS